MSVVLAAAVLRFFKVSLLCAFFTMVRFSFLQVVGSNRAASSLTTTPYSLVQFPLDENEKRVSHSPLENESKVST